MSSGPIIAKPFEWNGWENKILPELESHSSAKLDVVRTYVEDYIQILCRDAYGQDTFKITLVDGFAGGGCYADGKLGSPFVLMQAVETAEAQLNDFGRHKKLTIDCHYYFIEEKPAAFECLKFALEQSQYASRLNKNIFLRKGTFQECSPEVVQKSKVRHPKGGARVIFFLDQCGYTDVDPRLIRNISGQLGKSEFIVNFAIEWLTDFLGDNEQFRVVYPKLGLDSELSIDQLIRAKELHPDHWKFIVESMIGPAFRKISGSKFFSPFYIEPEGSHRGYWLLHLAPHARARSAMLDVHWKNANTHKHYGNSGLNMLAYKPDANPMGYFEGMSFNSLTRDLAKRELLTDFARVIRDSHPDGISFSEFNDQYCNHTIANTSLMAETLVELAKAEQILISGPKGGGKRSESLEPDDILKPPNQFVFSNITLPVGKKS